MGRLKLVFVAYVSRDLFSLMYTARLIPKIIPSVVDRERYGSKELPEKPMSVYLWSSMNWSTILSRTLIGKVLGSKTASWKSFKSNLSPIHQSRHIHMPLVLSEQQLVVQWTPSKTDTFGTALTVRLRGRLRNGTPAITIKPIKYRSLSVRFSAARERYWRFERKLFNVCQVIKRTTKNLFNFSKRSCVRYCDIQISLS